MSSWLPEVSQSTYQSVMVVAAIMLIVLQLPMFWKAVKSLVSGGADAVDRALSADEFRSRFRSGFTSVGSDVASGVIDSGAGVRFATSRDDLGSTPTGGLGFLGGPEPPVFYNIGDLNETKKTMNAAQAAYQAAAAAAGAGSLADAKAAASAKYDAALAAAAAAEGLKIRNGLKVRDGLKLKNVKGFRSRFGAKFNPEQTDQILLGAAAGN